MADKSEIQWTDATWNPVSGCTKISPGCKHCYAERIFPRVYGREEVPVTTGSPGVGPATRPRKFTDVVLHPDRLDLPLHWRKPRRIFVNSMSDLFHEDVPDEFIRSCFQVMVATPKHTYQVLTKRPERMQALVPLIFEELFAKHIRLGIGERVLADHVNSYSVPPNIWLGVSCEDQPRADERIPLLLKTPAAVRFVSLEPLLGAIDLTPWLYINPSTDGDTVQYRRQLDWVIVGGESGGSPERALVEKIQIRTSQFRGQKYDWRPKPEPLEWVRSIRDQCIAAGVPFFFKQWGGPTPKSGGRMLDGREWDEMPERKFPTTC